MSCVPAALKGQGGVCARARACGCVASGTVTVRARVGPLRRGTSSVAGPRRVRPGQGQPARLGVASWAEGCLALRPAGDPVTDPRWARPPEFMPCSGLPLPA